MAWPLGYGDRCLMNSIAPEALPGDENSSANQLQSFFADQSFLAGLAGQNRCLNGQEMVQKSLATILSGDSRLDQTRHETKQNLTGFESICRCAIRQCSPRIRCYTPAPEIFSKNITAVILHILNLGKRHREVFRANVLFMVAGDGAA